MKKAKQTHRTGLRWCELICDGYLGLLFTLFLLLCVPYDQITDFKYLLFRLLAGGFVATSVVLMIELVFVHQLTFADIRKAAEGKKSVLACVLAYAAFTGLSAMMSPYFYDVWNGMSRNDGVLTQFLYAASFVLLALFGKMKHWHVAALGGTTLVFCGICTLQLMGGNPLSLYPAGCNYYDAYVKYSGEFLGTIGNAGLVAAFLAMVIGLFYGLIIAGEDKKRFLAVIPLATAVVVLLMSKIAAGYVAVAVTILVVIPLALQYKKSKYFKKVLVGETAIIVGFLIFAYLYDFGGSGTLYELHELLHFNLKDDFGSGRIKIWRQVLAEMPQHLLLGTGPDSMKAWEMEGFSKFVPVVGETIHHSIDDAHNEYLNITAQQGLLAVAAYIALLVVILKRFLREKKNVYNIALFAATFSYAVQAFFGISSCIVTPLFLSFLGLLVNQTTSDITEEA